MKRLIACLLSLFCLCGCARVNRYHADFYGTTQLATFTDRAGLQEPVILLHVNRTENIKVIGHDNQFLPLSNYVAILTISHNRIFNKEAISNNIPVRVNGILDNGWPVSKNQSALFPADTNSNRFYLMLKVKRIKELAIMDKTPDSAK